MVVLKEIKTKDYLKGTKAARGLYYFAAGMIGLTALLGIPLYLSAIAGRPEALEKKRAAEEAKREQASQYLQLQGMLYEKLETPEKRNETQY